MILNIIKLKYLPEAEIVADYIQNNRVSNKKKVLQIPNSEIRLSWYFDKCETRRKNHSCILVSHESGKKPHTGINIFNGFVKMD